MEHPDLGFGNVVGKLEFPFILNDDLESFVIKPADDAFDDITFPVEPFLPEVQTQIPDIASIYSTFASKIFTPQPSSNPLLPPSAPRIKALRPEDRLRELQSEVLEFRHYLEELRRYGDDGISSSRIDLLDSEVKRLSKSLDNFATNQITQHSEKSQDLSERIERLKSFCNEPVVYSEPVNSFNSINSKTTIEQTVIDLKEIIGPIELLPKNQSISELIIELNHVSKRFSSDHIKSLQLLVNSLKSRAQEAQNSVDFLNHDVINAIKYLHEHLKQFNTFREIIPKIINKLESMCFTEMKAQTALADVAYLKNNQIKLMKMIEDQNKVIEILSNSFNENCKISSQNFEKINEKLG
ncbi:hypothetical protein RCL1_001442 [Eukaryota sp. TZLM3-RCL]